MITTSPHKAADQSEQIINNALNYVWREIRDCFDYYHAFDKELKFSGNEDYFVSEFHKVYNRIKDTYMRKDVVELDRHKVVAAQITACIECGLITRDVEEDQVFMGLYMIALEVGLNWMLMGLNQTLKDAGISKEIDQYTMPKAFACPTRYFDIFARNLYYAHKTGKGLNPLDISEKLFLLEYITLLSNNIPPEMLEYKALEEETIAL